MIHQVLTVVKTPIGFTVPGLVRRLAYEVDFVVVFNLAALKVA